MVRSYRRPAGGTKSVRYRSATIKLTAVDPLDDISTCTYYERLAPRKARGKNVKPGLRWVQSTQPKGVLFFFSVSIGIIPRKGGYVKKFFLPSARCLGGRKDGSSGTRTQDQPVMSRESLPSGKVGNHDLFFRHRVFPAGTWLRRLHHPCVDVSIDKVWEELVRVVQSLTLFFKFFLLHHPCCRAGMV